MKAHFSIRTSLILAGAAVGLAACGGGDNDFTPPPTGVVTPPPPVTPPAPPPTPPTGDGSPEGQAGAGFAASFRQGPFDEPTDPVTGDIIPLDKTTDPYDIPNP